MKSMGPDQAIIGAAVPEESTFFKISPSPTTPSDAWLLSPLPNGAADSVTAGEFRVSFAANEQVLAEQQKRIADLPATGTEFEVKRKNDRICFSGREIVLQCAATERDARLGMLKDFCRLYARISELEKQVAELLKGAKQDTAYTGRVDASLLPEYERLSAKNRSAIVARIDFAEIKREIANAEDARGEGKLFSELLEASGIEERIELLDDEIEVTEEVYGVCIDRLSEFSYFWREFKAELWIILILVVELVEFFFDIYFQMFPTPR